MINNLDKIEDVEVWFVGFEKGLRERLAEAEQEKKRLKVEEPENRIAWNFLDSHVKAIKEMLGDKRK